MPRQVDPPARVGRSGRGVPYFKLQTTCLSCRRAGVPPMLVPIEVGCAGLGCSWGKRTGLRRRHPEDARGSWWAFSRGKVGRTWPGAIAGPADLFSAKPNWEWVGEGGGRAVAGRDRHPGAGSIPRLEMAPFSRDGQCGEEKGWQRGFPALPTSRTWAETAAGEAGLAGLSLPHARRCSLEGLPLLPELLYGARGRGRGRGRG